MATTIWQYQTTLECVKQSDNLSAKQHKVVRYMHAGALLVFFNDLYWLVVSHETGHNWLDTFTEQEVAELCKLGYVEPKDGSFFDWDESTLDELEAEENRLQEQHEDSPSIEFAMSYTH